MPRLLVSTLLAFLLLLSGAAQALEGSRRVMNWADLLGLDTAQQEQIKNIEKAYQSRFSDIRENLGPSWGEHFDEQQWLQERLAARDLFAAMRIELQSVLTSEQRQRADDIVRKFHSRATRGILARMARGIDLTENQLADMDILANQVIGQFSWPVDHSQIEAGRVGIERIFSEVLTPAQLMELQQRERDDKRSWPTLDNLSGSPFREPDDGRNRDRRDSDKSMRSNPPEPRERRSSDGMADRGSDRMSDGRTSRRAEPDRRQPPQEGDDRPPMDTGAMLGVMPGFAPVPPPPPGGSDGGHFDLDELCMRLDPGTGLEMPQRPKSGSRCGFELQPPEPAAGFDDLMIPEISERD